MKKMVLILVSAILFIHISVYAEGKEGLAQELGIRLERYSDEEKISRIEFSCMVARALRYDGTLDAEDPFADVRRYESGAGELAFLKRKGIVFGDENGAFEGKKPITLNQALVIAARATLNGYIDYKKINFNSANFEALARKLNLRRGISEAADSETLTADSACMIIYNMLTAEAMDLTSVTKTGNGYTNDYAARGSLLSQYWNCDLREAIVSATDVTDLYGGKPLRKNQIMADGKVFSDESGVSGEYIGQNVVLISDSEDNIVYIFPSGNKITEIDFNSDIEYENFSLDYYDDKGKRVKAKLSDGYSAIYNGKAYAYDGSSSAFEGNGSVRLIDNNDDGIYEIMNISKYKYIVIEELSYNDMAVYDRLTGQDRICFNDFTDGCRLYVVSGGIASSSDFSGLECGMVLRCVISEDGLYAEIYACGENFSGRVERLSESSLIIDGEEHEISDRYFDSSKVAVGGEYTFYLSDDGKIIHTSASGGNLEYGYVIGAAKKQGKIDGKFMIKLLDGSGDVNIYKTAERVTLDGKNIKSESDEFKNNFLDLQAKTKYQLIKYSLNGDGMLNKIDTTTSNSATEEYVGSCNADDNLICYIPREKLQYKTSQLFVQKFRINAKTALFTVPEKVGTSEESVYDESLFSKVDIGFLKNDGRYIVEAYDMSFNGVAKAVVIYTDEQSKVSSTSDVIVVDSIYEAAEDGGARKKMDYWCGGSFKSAFFSSDFETEEYPEAGDILRVSYKDGKISGVNLDYDRSTGEIDTEASSSITAQYFITSADPVYFRENCLIASVNGERMVFPIGGASVVRYNKRTNRIFGSNTGELKEIYARGFGNGKILLTMNYNSVKNCVIYED